MHMQLRYTLNYNVEALVRQKPGLPETLSHEFLFAFVDATWQRMDATLLIQERSATTEFLVFDEEDKLLTKVGHGMMSWIKRHFFRRGDRVIDAIWRLGDVNRAAYVIAIHDEGWARGRYLPRNIVLHELPYGISMEQLIQQALDSKIAPQPNA